MPNAECLVPSLKNVDWKTAQQGTPLRHPCSGRETYQTAAPVSKPTSIITFNKAYFLLYSSVVAMSLSYFSVSAASLLLIFSLCYINDWRYVKVHFFRRKIGEI